MPSFKQFQSYKSPSKQKSWQVCPSHLPCPSHNACVYETRIICTDPSPLWSWLHFTTAMCTHYGLSHIIKLFKSISMCHLTLPCKFTQSLVSCLCNGLSWFTNTHQCKCQQWQTRYSKRYVHIDRHSYMAIELESYILLKVLGTHCTPCEKHWCETWMHTTAITCSSTAQTTAASTHSLKPQAPGAHSQRFTVTADYPGYPMATEGSRAPRDSTSCIRKTLASSTYGCGFELTQFTPPVLRSPQLCARYTVSSSSSTASVIQLVCRGHCS